MPSSISNSRNTNWGKSWLTALLIAASILLGLEIFWRINGHLPAIVDDQSLWALERNKIGKTDKEIALLGSSRMLTDISAQTLRKLASQYNIINLSANSTCANAVLNDLANNTIFKGVALVETTSECLMFGNEPWLSQKFYVDYYHKTHNLNTALNRHISTFVQKHLAIIDPYLNLIKVAGDLVVKKKWRTPNYVTTHEDRSRAANYTKLDIIQHKATRLKKVEVNYNNLASVISVQTLIKKVTDLDNSVKQIQLRGGKVIFVRFPVSDEHWVIDEQYFPRNIYWDNLSAITTAQLLHFRDIEGMNKLQCPDTSHLDVKDTPEFTRLLFEQLIRINLI